MKCGDKGHVTATGEPCGQTIGASASACIWHSRTPDERRLLALKGGIASRMRSALPASTPEPPFDTVENIIAWAQRMARSALVDDVDPRRLAEARGFAQLALTALSARTQAQLVGMLEKFEHGGLAAALFLQMTSGSDAPKRRVPWRQAPSLPSGDDAA